MNIVHRQVCFNSNCILCLKCQFLFSFVLDINLDISYTTTATLLASETRYQYIRCVAPSFRSSTELLLAVGCSNGKVGLCNFVSSNENSLEFSE